MSRSRRRRSYTVIDHTADIALRVYGESRESLFANAAAAMFEQMAPLDQVPHNATRRINVDGADDESLLVAWLSELLYLRDVHGEAYTHFAVTFPQPERLQGIAEGGPWTAFDRPVKAVTFHGLVVEQKADGWQATIVFDV